MYIEVKIPYEPKEKLAIAYNRAMEFSTSEWVLLLDHDVFLACNPKWYEICLDAISNVSQNTGLITCYCGGEIDSKRPVPNSDIEYHISEAKRVYLRNKNKLSKINEPVAGFFMLVRRSVWEKIRFNNQKHGVNKIDRDFSQRLRDNGYEIYRMEGLYVYHRRKIRKLKW